MCFGSTKIKQKEKEDLTNFCPGDSGGPITLELEMQLRIFKVLEKEKKFLL